MQNYKEIEANALAALLADASIVLVDVRNDDEVARGIIQNAIHIPLAMLPAHYDPLAKAQILVFYCHSGVRSAHAAAFAVSKGCENAYNLAGGVLAWHKAGLPFVAKS